MTSRQQLFSIRVEGTHLLDGSGRDIILRGVNLGADAKLPFPDGGTHIRTDFSDHREVSFIGRPFPLAEAAAHFARISRWGFNCVRLLTTWEAVEHAGPGRYDDEYLDYFCAVVEEAGRHGIRVFIDFHQDVWSRMSGGAGAPGWTLERVGLDFKRFPAAQAALVMQAAMDFDNPNPHQASYPKMAWSSNYLAPVSGIMWTLFWLGRQVTPQFEIDGQNVQDFLQGRYLAAVDEMARRMARYPQVIGFDSLNEPGLGWVGTPLSARLLPGTSQRMRPLKPGPAWSPLESLALAQGLPITLPLIERDPQTLALSLGPDVVLNAERVRIWQQDRHCPFEAAGIYALQDGRAIARREHAFAHIDGRPIEPSSDIFAPFFHRVASTVRRHREDWLLFAEMDPYALALGRYFPQDMPQASVNASHWYDTQLLYTKRFDRDDNTRLERYRAQLGGMRAVSEAVGLPTLIGEFGTPYDLDDAHAYELWAQGRRDDEVWAEQEAALGAMYGVLDELRIHSMQWNYTASNRNDAWIGDGWNQEDLSIYSTDQGERHDGARARRGFDRPYVRAAQGRLREVSFLPGKRRFEALIAADASIDAPTEIHLPEWLQSERMEIDCSGAPARLVHAPQQRLLSLTAEEDGELRIVIYF
jgi:hypothetical protein